MYRLPYLEIVGVTSTGMTFSVGSVYLEAEKEENYTWALGVLRDLLGEVCLPTVIITDHKKALMNAVASKFLESRHFLCTWHIARNVFAKCKGHFTSNVRWEDFYNQFNRVMFANSEKDFEDAIRVLHSDFATSMKSLDYVMNQWINPYKERFVTAWTNQVMHFGNTTSNRVESHHSALKMMLGNSLGKFETNWVKTGTLFEAFSTCALEMLFDEMKEVRRENFDPSTCTHILRRVYGLPCAHELHEYARADKPIPINIVDAFWRKLDIEPMIKEDVDEDIDHHFWDAVDDMVAVYKTYDQNERLVFFRRMRELANPVTTNLVEPSPRLQTRGRPKSDKK
ncbi:hypothetical protein ACS0TY_001926 [Phlomoides rotata]